MKNYLHLDMVAPTFGFRCRNDWYVVPAEFDPWTGMWIYGEFYNNFVDFVATKTNNANFKLPAKKVVSQSEMNRYLKRRRMHINSFVCDELEEMITGIEKGQTSFAYIPTIRTFAFFKKHSKGVFDAMDYCPFCGARFPERLDEKLTEILQTEYGLQSWKDYKKAPHEFHTDEWWKNRGL